MKRFFAISLCAALLNSCGGAHVSEAENPLTPEAGEELSGGDTTVFITTGDAFNQFAANLTFDQQGDFKIGNSFFEQDWVTAPSTTTARDGLGPVFNARSCAACHAKDGRGEPPVDGQEPVGILLRLSVPGEGPDGGPLGEPNYGEQLNNRSILGVSSEGTFSVSYEEIPGTYDDGTPYSLRKPTYTIFNLSFGELDPDTLISPRVAPQMVGMGLLEAIPEAEILKNADPDDANGDGVSGRPNYVHDAVTGSLSLGRFGWKANVPSVDQQVAGAFLGDIGVTSSIFPNQNCEPSQADCQAAANGGEPEVEGELLDTIVFYSKTLAVPARRSWDDATVLSGKKIFNEIGCVRCHFPQTATDPDYPITQLAGQTIRPYTDLLLHDMGEALADGRPDFLATGSEWRTPPLWGIGLIEKVNGHTNLLHDGRARNAEEAVLWHGGEGQGAREAFTKLTAEERAALLRFLDSL